MPYLHSLQNGAENTVTGYLNVSVCGGNTANTEFEFLTGNSMAFLPQGSIPYQQYITKELPALPAYLASLGYETVATHPYYADGWDRDKVYPLLGFSESILKTSTGEQVMCASTSVIIAVWIRSLNYMRKRRGNTFIRFQCDDAKSRWILGYL